MKTMITLGALLTMTTLALAGCQGEEIDRETTEQDLTAAAPALAKATDEARPFRHGRPDPAKMFARADKNADGVLVESEVEARHWAFLKVADTDGDARLTKAELEAAHTAGTLRPVHPGGGERPGHKPPTIEGMLERFDTNHDGKLEPTEMPERMRERIQASDADSNGVLERPELEAHFAEMKARFDSH